MRGKYVRHGLRWCCCVNVVFVLGVDIEFLVCDAYALNIALYMAVCADSACGANIYVRHGLRWGCCVNVVFFWFWDE